MRYFDVGTSERVGDAIGQVVVAEPEILDTREAIEEIGNRAGDGDRDITEAVKFGKIVRNDPWSEGVVEGDLPEAGDAGEGL